MTFEIVTREVWGALDSLSEAQTTIPITLVIVANTFTRPCNSPGECRREVRRLQHLHMEHQHKPDIRYNFLVCGDGKVYEGRGWGVIPSMPWKYKRYVNGFIIAFVGQYLASQLPPEMSAAGAEVLKYGLRQGYINYDYALENHQRRMVEAKFKVRD